VFDPPFSATGGPGLVVTLDNQGESGPLQYTLGPGTYRITNGATSGTYSAWRFNDSGGDNWAWSFVIAADDGGNTATVLDVGYAGGVWASQAAAAGATGIKTYRFNTVLSSTTVAGYTDTFTLASTTKLDFFIIDYYLPDNAGGVALNITPLSTVPEPATWAMTLLGFAGLSLASRRAWLRRSIPRGT
jgi:hypothetical protein